MKGNWQVNIFKIFKTFALVLAIACTSSAKETSQLIVFKTAAALPYLRAICARSQEEFLKLSAPLNLPPECHLPRASCNRIFSNALPGVAGAFNAAQLTLLTNKCIPPGSILYQEVDAAVFKAEDESMFQPTFHRRLFHRRSLKQPGTGNDFEQLSAVNGGPLNVSALAEGMQIDSLAKKQQILTAPLWNLDRLDQARPPLDGMYSYGSNTALGLGRGVTIYVLDTGIMLNHQEFQQLEANASTSDVQEETFRVSCGWNFIDENANCTDLDGHGSHVSGSAIGLQVGVAKGAQIVAVKILDDHGMGSVSSTIAGLDYVAAYHKKPAVVTLSLGVQRGQFSQAMEDAVRALVDHGVVVVAAAGNANADSCQFSPAASPQAITVAASDLTPRPMFEAQDLTVTALSSAAATAASQAGSPSSTTAGTQQQTEGVYRLGNQGACIDLFAPGVDIYSVCGGTRRCGPEMSTRSYAWASGTSMAVPHVAGAAALYLEIDPHATPGEVADALLAASIKGSIDTAALRPDTPNRILTVAGLQQQVASVQAAQGPSQAEAG